MLVIFCMCTDTDSHNWGGHNEVNNGHSLRLPLLVVAACVVIPALIAAAIVFAVVKFRKRLADI